MKININYLKSIHVSQQIIDYYQQKYGYNDFDLIEIYQNASNDHKIWGIMNFDLKKVKYLLKQEIDINIKDSANRSILKIATILNKSLLISLLKKYGAKE